MTDLNKIQIIIFVGMMSVFKQFPVKVKLDDLFNADEFGWFYQCLPNKTFHLSAEKCSVRKKSKEVRLTGMATVSVTAEKLPMFVVGKSKTQVF